MQCSWKDRLYSCTQSIDRENIEQKFNWIYRRSGLPEVRVFYARSTGEAKRMITAIQDPSFNDNVLATITNDELMQRAVGKEETHLSFGWYCDAGDYGWVDDLEQKDSKGEKQQDDFYIYRDLLKLNVFASYQFNQLAIVIDMPTELNMTDWQNRLVPHSTTGPAIGFRDGYAEYFWRGIRVSEKVVMSPESITRADLVGEKNAEVRRAMKEIMGTKLFMNALDVEVIDEQTDNQGNIMKLLRTREKDELVEDYIWFYNCLCPSTLREYCLIVPGVDEKYPKGIRNVWDAKAWTFQMKAAEFETDIET